MNINQEFRKLLQFIEEKIVLRNIVLALLILLFGTTIIMQILKLTTRHNQNLSVPDFAGMTFQEASDAAGDRNMRVEVFDSVFLADFERGTVVEQHPRAGFMVKKNRKIFLNMNAMNTNMIAIPNLIDLTFIQTREKLE
jgi:beta-lactam-binding protein with PASTA domain